MRTLLMFCLAWTVVAAQAGENFAYQAVLCHANGQPMCNQATTVKIGLYSQVSGGGALWMREGIPVQTDTNGLINVELSDEIGQKVSGVTNTLAQAFSKAAGAGSALYLGLTVAGSAGEIRPRQRMLRTPLASVARDGLKATGDFTVKGSATVKEAATFSSQSSVQLQANATFATDVTFKSRATFLNGLGVTGGDLGTMPVGTVIMWWGDPNQPPAGWQVCNGHQYNGQWTPNLVNRFPLGAGGKYTKGFQGGRETVGLTLAQMPKHQHLFPGTSVQNAEEGGNNPYKDKGEISGVKGLEKGSWRLRKYNLRSVGGGVEHENMPPFRTLFFIMKVQ